MKRRFFILIVAAALLCAVSSALAANLTWNQSCTKKTSRATMLYVQVDGEEKLQEASMLPAGTYIRTTGQSLEGKTGISYSANNSDPLYGYIDGKAITNASVKLALPNGETVTVGEALVQSQEALNIWLNMNYGITLDGKTYVDENGEEHDIGHEAAGGTELNMAGDMIYYRALADAFSKYGGSAPAVYRDDEGGETTVDVCYMGLMRSMIMLDGKKQLVETARLSWDTEAPADKVLAVVQAIGSKEVKFHAKSSTKGTILKRVLTGQVVRVIKTGPQWTLVDLNDPEMPRGYIATMYLDFYPNIPMQYTPAKVSIAGKTKGNDTAWIHGADDGSMQYIKEITQGEPLTVYAENGTWSEVDVDGFHAFIRSKYVTAEE